jgi:hypothetical protein
MQALAFHLPLALVMLGATIWLFVIATWKPRWFKQTTLWLALWSALEGAILAVLWMIAKPLVEQVFGFSGLITAAGAGLAWGGMSFYGKLRFRADLYESDRNLLNRIFRR